MNDLQRFRDAQDHTNDGLAAALAELHRGRKQGHWIWYVFPQLAGLGTSAAARQYAIADRAEADAYLRDDDLRDRYARAVAAISTQLCRLLPPQLDQLMGSRVDALKLVSSLTLFEAVATDLAADAGDDNVYAGLAEEIGGVLAVAEVQGYERCATTLERLAASGTTRPA